MAGLSAQEGEAFARQWMRQCLRSVLNHGYVELREQQKQAARLARGKEILSPMSHLRNFLRHRPELKPVWTIEVKGEREEYRATVELLGLKTVGSAKSVRMAKQNAAEKLMDLIWVRSAPQSLVPLTSLTSSISAASGRPRGPRFEPARLPETSHTVGCSERSRQARLRMSSREGACGALHPYRGG